MDTLAIMAVLCLSPRQLTPAVLPAMQLLLMPSMGSYGCGGGIPRAGEGCG